MKTMTKFEKLFLGFIERYKDLLFMMIISVAALLIRGLFKEFKSVDFNNFLINWCNYIKDNGGFKAIASIRSDYNVVYLYLLTFFTYIPGRYIIKIKFLSIIFDYLIAVGTYFITKEVLKNDVNKKMIASIVYSVVLFIPVVILNGSVWAQCDSIYTTFIIFSLYYILKNKNKESFILYGIALTFKLQAIFLFPMYIILYIKNKNFSILNFLWIPFVNFIIYIPALFVGRPLSSILSAYVTQVGENDSLVMNYPNIYNLLPKDIESIGQAGIIFTIILLGIIAYILISSTVKIDSVELVGISALIILVAVYFLPHMHERYAFCGEILVVIYYILKRKCIYIPVMLVTLITGFYLNFLCGADFVDPIITSIIQLGIIVFIFNDLIVKIFMSKS